MRIGKIIIVATVIALSIPAVMLIWTGDGSKSNQSARVNIKALIEGDTNSALVESSEIPSELRTVVGSLSRLEQALLEVNQGSLEQEIKEADAMVVEMDKIISQSSTK